MRLASFKAHGFKSFVEPAAFKVGGELTGIVGPNGCGKSNIVDAIRWVLGESRASSMRASALADVMFNGSEKQQPADWCHVELRFINNSAGESGSMWAAYPEIIVRRELSRDGKQAYQINGMNVRRRDVVDLFRGTGVAPRAYGVIEQGMVTDIAEASPEELRNFMEEAAGVSHYKERRRDSERRLQNSGDNLAQLTLILDGLLKRAESLKRQARTARRYRELGEEINRLDALLILTRRAAAEAALADSRRQLKEQEEKIRQQQTALNDLKTADEEKKQQSETLQTQVDAAMARLGEAQKVLTAAEQAIHHAVQGKEATHARLQEAEAELTALTRQEAQLLQDETEAEAQSRQLALDIRQGSGSAESEAEELSRLQVNREQAQHEVDAAREQLTATQRQLESKTVRQQMMVQQLEDMGERLTAAQRAQDELAPLPQADDSTDEQEQQLGAAETALNAAQTKLTALQRRAEAADGVIRQLENDGAMLTAEINTLDAMLREDHWPQGGERLAQVLQVEAGSWARALDAALGFYAAAVAVEDMDAFIAANDRLPAGAALIETTPEEPALEANQTGLPTLLSQLQVPEPGQRLLAYWLNGIYAAPDDDSAAAARRQLSPRQYIVTAGGAIYGRHSLFVSGEARGGYDWEQRHRHLIAAQRKKDAALSKQKKAHAEAQAAVQAQQAHIAALSEQQQQWQDTLFERRVEINRRLERQQLQQARQAELTQQIQDLQEQQQQQHSEQSALTAAIDALKSDQQAQQKEFDRVKNILEHAGNALESYREVVQESSLKRHSLERRAEELKRQQEERVTRKRENSEQRQLITRRINGFKSDLQKHDEGQLKQALSSRRGQFSACEAEVAALRGQQRDKEKERAQLEEQREQRRGALEQQQRQITDMRLQEQECTLQVGSFNDALDELALSPAQLQALQDDSGGDSGQWQREIDDLRGKRDRLGAINFMAESELHDHESKISEMQAQKDDIEKAIAELRAAIRRIDEETTTRLQSMYDAVNREFALLYKRIFDGGDAHLEMTGESILEAGFELKVRPPGKRLFPVRMLSGGEKAAAAAAFIFSILRLNPPPFCILDEVDAPLDDHRTRRFVELLQDISRTVQCLVISHNKSTIAALPRLIGVTQEEPGASKIISVTLGDALRAAGT